MEAGDIIGTVQETVVVVQKIMVPYGVKGTVKEIKGGEFTVEEDSGCHRHPGRRQGAYADAEMAGPQRPSLLRKTASGDCRL